MANTKQTVQRTQYYPTGLPWASNSGDNPSTQTKKYNGKEFLEMHGLDEYDSEARMYYPAIGRTTTLDPHSESYYSVSPYVWCSNNFINRFDPDGRDDTYYNSKGVQTKVVERSWLFELFAGNRNYISDDKGKNFNLTNQALDVVKSGKFNGFESNWETSNSKTGFNSPDERRLFGEASSLRHS